MAAGGDNWPRSTRGQLAWLAQEIADIKSDRIAAAMMLDSPKGRAAAEASRRDIERGDQWATLMAGSHRQPHGLREWMAYVLLRIATPLHRLGRRLSPTLSVANRSRRQTR